jgi:hypothetical protein
LQSFALTLRGCAQSGQSARARTCYCHHLRGRGSTKPTDRILTYQLWTRMRTLYSCLLPDSAIRILSRLLNFSAYPAIDTESACSEELLAPMHLQGPWYRCKHVVTKAGSSVSTPYLVRASGSCEWGSIALYLRRPCRLFLPLQQRGAFLLLWHIADVRRSMAAQCLLICGIPRLYILFLADEVTVSTMQSRSGTRHSLRSP